MAAAPVGALLCTCGSALGSVPLLGGTSSSGLASVVVAEKGCKPAVSESESQCTNIVIIKKRTRHKDMFYGAGEMAQRLRELAALPEVLSSIPNNHMVTLNYL